MNLSRNVNKSKCSFKYARVIPHAPIIKLKYHRTITQQYPYSAKKKLAQKVEHSMKKTLLFKKISFFLHILDHNCVLNTMLPSDLPYIRFSHKYMLKFRKLQVFAESLFIALGNK